MRFARSASVSAMLIFTGCASYSATIVQLQKSDAGTDAGNETGGTTSAGGASSTSGANAGGNSSAGGNSNAGGNAGTGGTSGCTKDADCVNPDPINCSFTCANPGSSGVCKPAATITPTKCATSACDDKAISGFWDAQGKPNIAFGWTETDGTATIRMQQLKLDGSLDGTAVPYKLPALDDEPGLLSSAAQGSKVAFLWTTSRVFSAAQRQYATDFALTDTAGTGSTPAELSSSVTGEPVGEVWLHLQVTLTGAWLGLGIGHSSDVTYWHASSGSSIAAWSSLDSSVYEGEFASGVVGNTLMLTGSDCPGVSGCQMSFKLQRFSAANLSSIGSFISLSQNLQANEFPAMGPVGGQMALLWTETQSPGELFRTLIKEDGTFALAVDTTPSSIQPKAIVESADGGALLIGTIASGTPTTYQLIGQRLDATLSLVGDPIAIADAQSSDASGFELHPSSDGGQVLITFRQAGSRYRIVDTNFCRNP